MAAAATVVVVIVVVVAAATAVVVLQPFISLLTPISLGTQIQPMCCSQCHKPSFTPIPNNRQNYSSAIRNILYRMIASVVRLQFVLNCFLNSIFILTVVPKYISIATHSKDLLPVFMQ